MQRAESKLMIDTIVYRLYSERPDVPLITVHDSILTTPPYVVNVKSIVYKEYARAGLRPTLRKVEYDSEGSGGDTGVVAAA